MKALFVIGSPLQAICAAEAVNYYGLNDYKILVVNARLRQEQVIKVFSELQLPCSVVNISHMFVALLKSFLKVLFCFRGKYDILFMGDYRNITAKNVYLPYVKNKGKVVYLDDGNYILVHAEGKLKIQSIYRFLNHLFTLGSKVRGVSINNYFTIYADELNCPSWNLEKNNFNSLHCSSIIQGKKVYVIGTNTISYCEYLGLRVESFLLKQQDLFEYIKNTHCGCDIIYVPHGRDLCKENEESCRRNGIFFTPTDKCVELYITKQNDLPIAIYGYTSTALFTLRIMLPNIPIFNVFFSGNNKDGVKNYNSISDTYNSKGIPTIRM